MWPLGYLLTWTTYGTWLHGDPRGSVDRDHHCPGAPALMPDPQRQEYVHRTLKHAPVALDEARRKIIQETIEAHCRFRRWGLTAINVRSNHVHVIVYAPTASPTQVMDQFKAWSTRRLREAGLLGHDQQAWTEGGSKRTLYTEQALNDATRYVLEGQGPDLS
jgi:REP element-mobilizing transposase RayT